MKKQFSVLRDILIIFISIILIFSTSCVKEKYDWEKISKEIELNPTLAAPLLKGSLTLDDILIEVSDEKAGKFPQDSLLYVAYSDTFMSYLTSETVGIPDQTFSHMFINSDITSNPEWTGSSVGDTVQFSAQKAVEFEVLHNEKIDSVKLTSCDLQIQVSSSFRHGGVLVIHTNSIKTNGQPFVRNIIINDASGTFNTTINIPLNNASIYLDNSDPLKTVLPIFLDLFLINSGAPVGAGDFCNISMNFQNIDFSSIYGYLGEYDLLVGHGEFNPGIFENINFDDDLIDGELLFYDPRFKILTNNSFGIPVEIFLSNVSAYSELNDVTTPITFTGVNPFGMDAPDIDHIGKFVEDSVIINRNNCNIVEAVNTSPSSISYDISAETNPEGPSGPYNFMTDSSRLDLVFEMVLPLWLNARGIILEDTSDLDIEKEIGDIESINYFRITFEGKNEFPLETALQITFLDSLNNSIDSLFTENFLILDPAEVGVDGRVKKAVDFKKMIEPDKETLSRIMETKKVIIRALLNTSNSDTGQHIKLFSYYKIDFKMSVKTNLTINLRLD